MFVDYLTIMIINIVAGLVITAYFALRHFEKDRFKVAPGFLLTGFISLVTGLHLTFTWPLPGSYNIPFGEMSVLYGGLYVCAGMAVLLGWDLLTLTIYAVFAGAASILVGARIFSLGLTSEPLVAAAGFILTGLAGVLSLPAYLLRKNLPVRIVAILVLLGAAAIWAVVGYAAYWQHMASFGTWKPPTMLPAPAK